MKLSTPASKILGEQIKRKTAILYARVSSRQQKEDETIESQVSLLLNFSKEMGYEIHEEWIFRDDGYSGYILSRPGLDKIRDLAREGVVDAIFVHSPDRLARRYVYLLLLGEEFHKFGVQLIYLKGGSKNDSPEDTMLAHFQGIFAEYERSQILDRTRRGKLYKVRQGDLNMLSKVPYGYCGDRNEFFYTIKENEAQIVREIFRLFTRERCNLRQISMNLEKKGIKAPRGGLKWDISTIKGTLKNTAYIGTAYFGKTEKYEGNTNRIVRYKKKGKVSKSISPTRLRPKELWEPLSVPQIITESDYEIAQELLKRNRELSARNTKEPSILQGILICGVCGRSYYKKRRMQKGINCTYYNCHSRLCKEIPSCTNRGMRQELLDSLVWNNLIELLKNPDLLKMEIDRRHTEDTENVGITERRNELKRELERIEKSQNKLLDAFQDGDCLTLDELRKRSKALKARNTTVIKELESLESVLIRREYHQELMYTLDIFKEKLDKSFETLSIRDKQIVVRTLIEDVVVFPDSIEIRHAIPIIEPNSLLCGVGEYKSPV